MAILMVISAIQFIGVTCLMNHVILFLWPLKMKDWLLCWIKSSTLNRMNFARENTLPLASSLSPSLPIRSKERWVSDMSAFNITVVLSYLAGSCLKVAVSCYTNRYQKIRLRITEYYTEHTQTAYCWLLHFIIIYLWKCISKDRISEPKILHKYWKSTEGYCNTNCWGSCCY